MAQQHETVERPTGKSPLDAYFDISQHLIAIELSMLEQHIPLNGTNMEHIGHRSDRTSIKIFFEQLRARIRDAVAKGLDDAIIDFPVFREAQQVANELTRPSLDGPIETKAFGKQVEGASSWESMAKMSTSPSWLPGLYIQTITMYTNVTKTEQGYRGIPAGTKYKLIGLNKKPKTQTAKA